MPAHTGDTVRVHYRGTLDDGNEFDSSYEREPLEFTLGEDSVIPGFEEGVCGLDVGAKRTVRIEPDEAYGPHNEALVHRVGNDVFEGDPYVGAEVDLCVEDGETLPGRVVIVDGDESILDFNHPLAGMALTFDVELVEILPA